MDLTEEGNRGKNWDKCNRINKIFFKKGGGCRYICFFDIFIKGKVIFQGNAIDIRELLLCLGFPPSLFLSFCGFALHLKCYYSRKNWHTPR